MKVHRLIYNWCQSGSTQDRDGAGEDYCSMEVGVRGVLSIDEHLPKFEGDRWNYIVNFDNGSCTRVFNPNQVDYIN